MGLTNLAATAIARTDGGRTRRGIRLTWDDTAQETLVTVQYKRGAQPWRGETISPYTVRSFELVPADGGAYEFRVWRQMIGGRISSHTLRFDFDPQAVELVTEPIRRPSGLQLIGPDGEQLGEPVAFTGRDLVLRWTALRLDARVQTEGVGEASADELLEFAVVRVVSPAGAIVREVQLPVNVTSWVYSYADAGEDFPLTVDPVTATQAIRIELRFKDAAGRLSDPTALETSWTRRLSNTPDLQQNAVNDVSSVASSSSIELTAAYLTEQELMSIDVDGIGAPVRFQFTDVYTLGLSIGNSMTVSLQYRIELNKYVLGSPVFVKSVHQTVFNRFRDSSGHSTTTAAQQPILTMLEELELGETYQFNVSFLRTRQGNGASPEVFPTIQAFSTDRVLDVQELKR